MLLLFDLPYYRNLLEKAWEEIAFAFRTSPLEKYCKKAGIVRCFVKIDWLPATFIALTNALTYKE